MDVPLTWKLNSIILAIEHKIQLFWQMFTYFGKYTIKVIILANVLNKFAKYEIIQFLWQTKAINLANG